MSTSEYSHGAGDIIGTFAAFRPSTLTALFLIVSSGIYLYARNALNYRVRVPILEQVRNGVD